MQGGRINEVTAYRCSTAFNIISCILKDPDAEVELCHISDWVTSQLRPCWVSHNIYPYKETMTFVSTISSPRN